MHALIIAVLHQRGVLIFSVNHHFKPVLSVHELAVAHRARRNASIVHVWAHLGAQGGPRNSKRDA